VFVVSDLAVDDVKKHAGEVAAYISHRKLTGGNDVVLITFEKANKDKDYLQLTVAQILEQQPRSFSDATDRALENLAALSSYAGEEIRVEGLDMCPVFYAKTQNYDALSYIIKSMQKLDLIEVNYYGSAFFPCGVTVGPKGWDRLAELDNGGAARNSPLVYLSCDETESGEAFRSVARKVVKEQGYKVIEMGTCDLNGGKVNYEVIAGVKRARFTICSIGATTGTTYYVAGMSQAMGKPTILTCHKSAIKKIHIDPAQISVLCWSDEKELYLQIQSAIRALV
jgi:hypothetical protein